MTRINSIEDTIFITKEKNNSKQISNSLNETKNNYLGIGPFSNELEFCLSNITAKDLINSTNLPLMYETNRRDMIELLISMKPNLNKLNDGVETLMSDLSKKVEDKNGQIYGGSTVLDKTINLKPKLADEDLEYLFGSAIKGFMNITSQQVVVGIKNEKIGWEIYNTAKYLTPLLIALTASSPYSHDQKNSLIKTGWQSIRPAQYEEMFKCFPNSFWRETKQINSISELESELTEVHNDTIKYIENGMILDTKWKELKKERTDSNGQKYTYENKIRKSETAKVFFYWFVRPRLAHETISKGGDCVMSLEFRAPDIALNKEYISNVNRFIIGTCNYIANNGGNTIIEGLNINKNIDVFNQMLECGKYGLNANINSEKASSQIQKLGEYAVQGLKLSNDKYNAHMLTKFLEDVSINGNPADRIQKAFDNKLPSINELKSYLIAEFQK